MTSPAEDPLHCGEKEKTTLRVQNFDDIIELFGFQPVGALQDVTASEPGSNSSVMRLVRLDLTGCVHSSITVSICIVALPVSPSSVFKLCFSTNGQWAKIQSGGEVAG